MQTYYLVMLRGSPIDAFSREHDAVRTARERSTRDGEATVLAVTPVQLELDFSEEAPTTPGHNHETCTYEVGGKWSCEYKWPR